MIIFAPWVSQVFDLGSHLRFGPTITVGRLLVLAYRYCT